LLPGLADENWQKPVIGSSGDTALREAADFYLAIKDSVRKLDNKFDVNTRILDFGCGFGRHLRFFLKDVPPDGLYGVDLIDELVDRCKVDLPTVNVQIGSVIPPLRFPDNFFDLVYAFSVFSHLNEETCLAWVKEFARLLRAGGSLIVSSHSLRFIDFCGSLRKDPALIGENLWCKNLAENAFLDLISAHQAYDRGEFVHSATGGGGNLTPDFYGETVLSPRYVKEKWEEYFRLVDFMDDPEQLSQALFVFQKT
jgi:SAM-dependent methyltransferase